MLKLPGRLVLLLAATTATTSCAISLTPADSVPDVSDVSHAVDTGRDAVMVCTGICTVGECVAGMRQTGNGRCVGGTFMCDTVMCVMDAGAPNAD